MSSWSAPTVNACMYLTIGRNARLSQSPDWIGVPIVPMACRRNHRSFCPHHRSARRLSPPAWRRRGWPRSANPRGGDCPGRRSRDHRARRLSGLARAGGQGPAGGEAPCHGRHSSHREPGRRGGQAHQDRQRVDLGICAATSTLFWDQGFAHISATMLLLPHTHHFAV